MKIYLLHFVCDTMREILAVYSTAEKAIAARYKLQCNFGGATGVQFLINEKDLDPEF
jgi:hypothetical protein